MIGHPRVHHRLTGSTNERAKQLAAAGAPHGSVVTADAQSAGRGRQGREWAAEPGGAVLMSVVIRHLHEGHSLLPLATAVAVCEAAEACAGVKCAIKWPNDVWIDGRKRAGILVEGWPQVGWAVVGVGLNVLGYPAALEGSAAALAFESTVDSRQSTEAVLAALLLALQRLLSAEPDHVLAAWRERDALKTTTIGWREGTGVAAGIDDTGALLVDTRNGLVALHAGEVHLHRVT